MYLSLPNKVWISAFSAAFSGLARVPPSAMQVCRAASQLLSAVLSCKVVTLVLVHNYCHCLWSHLEAFGRSLCRGCPARGTRGRGCWGAACWVCCLEFVTMRQNNAHKKEITPTWQVMGAQEKKEKRPQLRVQVAEQDWPLQGNLQWWPARGQHRNRPFSSDHFFRLNKTRHYFRLLRRAEKELKTRARR